MLAVVVSGCAHYEDRPLSTARTADEFDQRSLAAEGLREFAQTHRSPAFGTAPAGWPPAVWDLEALTLVAVYFSPALEVARAQVGVAEAACRTAGQVPNPVVSVTPGYNTTSAGISPWLVNFSLDVPIETGGKRGYRQAAAQHRLQVAQWRLVDAVWQVRSGVRHALFELEFVRRSEAVLTTQFTALSALARLVEQHVEAGDATSVEAALARANRDTTQVRLSAIRQTQAEALAGLAGAIGVPVRALEAADLAFPRREALDDAPLGAELRREALLGRPDILAALADYAASQSDLRLEIARQYPDVHLNPGYEFDQGDNKWMLGLSLELPVMNQNQGPIAEALARRHAAAARFRAAQAEVIGEVDRALLAWRAASDQIKVAAVLGADQRERRRQSRVLVEAGEADKLDLATAEVEFAAGEQNQIDAWAQAHRARIALEDALRQPLAQGFVLGELSAGESGRARQGAGH